MWRRQTGFDDFLELVLQWPYLLRGHTKTYYDYSKRPYSREVVNLDKQYILKRVADFEKEIRDYYGEDLESHGGMEAMKINKLKELCKWINYNASREFRILKNQMAYFKRLESYENP